MKESKDKRQWICDKCHYINDWSSGICASCHKPYDDTQLRTNREYALIAYDKDNNQVLIAKDYWMDGTKTVIKG